MAFEDHILLVTDEQKKVFDQNPTVTDIHYAKIEAGDAVEKAMLDFVKQTGLQIKDVRIRYRFSDWTIGPPLEVGKKLSCDVFIDVEV
jgi:hypothetical protein